MTNAIDQQLGEKEAEIQRSLQSFTKYIREDKLMFICVRLV